MEGLQVANYISSTATSLPYRLQVCAAVFVTERYLVRWRARQFFKECRLRPDRSVSFGIRGYCCKLEAYSCYFGRHLMIPKASTAQFQHRTYRVITMVRGSMVSIIYRKTLQLSASAVGLEDSKPVTLMSSDVERIGSGMEFLHESWSNVVEIVIALWLLEGQLGIAFVSAIFVAIGQSCVY